MKSSDGGIKMKKILKRALARFTLMTMVVTLLAGINIKNEVKAEGTVSLTNWTFVQGGEYDSSNTTDNVGYINTVKMNDTDEEIGEWLRGTSESINQTQMATQLSTGFSLDIANTGIDCLWKDWYGYDTDRLNPWSIQAKMSDVSIDPGHVYTVSFKAKATKKKYCHVVFGCEYEDLSPYWEDTPEGNDTIIALDTEEKTFTYRFTNWVAASKLTTTLYLGAFPTQYDVDGNDVSDIITETELCWQGTVYISDFKIIDEGMQPCSCVPAPDKPTTTSEAPTEIETTTNVEQKETTTAKVETTVKVRKTKILKATKVKSAQKAKISLKKVKGASKYEIQISASNKFKKVLVSKKIKKTSVFISSKRIKKKKKLYVRARALVIKNGKTYYGDWSKVKKVKIK